MRQTLPDASLKPYTVAHVAKRAVTHGPLMGDGVVYGCVQVRCGMGRVVRSGRVLASTSVSSNTLLPESSSLYCQEPCLSPLRVRLDSVSSHTPLFSSHRPVMRRSSIIRLLLIRPAKVAWFLEIHVRHGMRRCRGLP